MYSTWTVIELKEELKKRGASGKRQINRKPTMNLPPQDTYRDINSDTKLPQYNTIQPLQVTVFYHSQLQTARVSVVGDKIYLKGFCRKTMKSLQYESHCECPAASGLNAACKHVAVVLLGLEHMVHDKVYHVCTQKLQQFNVHTSTKHYTGTPVQADKLPRKRKPGKIIFRPYPFETLAKCYYNHRVRNLVLNFPNSNMPIKQLYKIY
ncbi:hypothetical protein ABMA27_003050 [Loxostege sticticalis]|uniref:SWIM-type domain-containing protein n=1 Tax=Loxostege sticticalis TaxID=481309 RepID=A0ABR3HRT8_LOXSC